MRNTETYRGACGRQRRGAAGFTLVELLTVMFIISLLIGLLIPSLNAARNSAKKTTTKATIRSLGTALELFKNENGRTFARTNGYPPSFAHPRMVNTGGADLFDPNRGEFPFIEDKPIITGAHWLPAMLMGLDQQGYVKRSSVPQRDNLRYEPWQWYDPDALDPGRAVERAGFYAEPGSVKTILTERLAGTPNLSLFDAASWEYIRRLPVIVDAFGQPVLYYVASANGTTTNMVEDERSVGNTYGTGPQLEGPPFYFHQDNHPFTGDEDKPGWDFDGEHAIAKAGDDLDAAQLTDPEHEDARNNFAWFILDRTILRNLQAQLNDGEAIPVTTRLRPVNADSYMLISAGVDGRWGTSDDVTNFPLAIEE